MNHPLLRTLLALLFLTEAATGCRRKPAAAPTPSTQQHPPPPRAASSGPMTVAMRIGGQTFHLEIANSHAEQMRGLMYRSYMPADHGMIFVNEEEAERSFWMKNTYIPLDILYLDAKGRVISIKQMKPLDLTGISSDGPAMYAIELNQGAAVRAGVHAGDRLTIPAEVRDPNSSR